MSRFLISCGGTGGHLSPGIALGEALVARGHQATLLISNKKVDARLIEKYAHLSFLRIPSAPFSLKPVGFLRFVIKQGAAQGYAPVLYVENTSHADPAAFEQALRAALAKLTATWPGLDLKRSGDNWEIVVPAKYTVGHEAHFAQVTEGYLRYLADGKMPAWEVPNMRAKYYTTTEAFRLSHASPAEAPKNR